MWVVRTDLKRCLLANRCGIDKSLRCYRKIIVVVECQGLLTRRGLFSYTNVPCHVLFLAWLKNLTNSILSSTARPIPIISTTVWLFWEPLDAGNLLWWAHVHHRLHTRFIAIYTQSNVKRSWYERVVKLAYLCKLVMLPLCFQAGAILVTGMGCFCGPLYHQALTGDPSFSKLAPIGGVLFIVGWLAMAI